MIFTVCERRTLTSRQCSGSPRGGERIHWAGRYVLALLVNDRSKDPCGLCYRSESGLDHNHSLDKNWNLGVTV